MFHHFHHRPVFHPPSAHFEGFQGKASMLPQLSDCGGNYRFCNFDNLFQELERMSAEGFLDPPGSPEEIGDHWKGAVLDLLEVNTRTSLFDDSSINLGQLTARSSPNTNF